MVRRRSKRQKLATSRLFATNCIFGILRNYGSSQLKAFLVPLAWHAACF